MRNGIVFFTGDYCPACKRVKPLLEGVAHETVNVSTPEGEAEGIRVGIQSLPTLIVYRDGEEVYRKAGGFERPDLAQARKAAGL